MGGEIDDAVIGERRALDRGFAGVLAEMNVGSRNAEVLCDRVEFVGGVGQLRQRLRKPRAIDAGALPEIGIGAVATLRAADLMRRTLVAVAFLRRD